MKLDELKIKRFTPHLFSGDIYAKAGCGATALSLLTGESPFATEYHANWKDGFMRSFLRKRGIKTFQLKEFGANSLSVDYPIGKNHVVLYSARLTKDQSSWMVLFNGYLFHNFEIVDFSAYELMNHPIVTAYICHSAAWS